MAEQSGEWVVRYTKEGGSTMRMPQSSKESALTLARKLINASSQNHIKAVEGPNGTEISREELKALISSSR